VSRVLLLLMMLFGMAHARPALELVESFPQGTDFDQPDIRNTQDVWLELIDGAESEILWHTFYVVHEPGEATGPVLDALKQAAARGVRVHLLVDPRFVITYPETLEELDALENIEVRESPVGKWLGGVMHAKMILVDGRSGFIGSQNFDWRSLTHIRELGVLFHDRELVGRYADVFRWEWNHYNDSSIPSELPIVATSALELGSTTLVPTVSPKALNVHPELGDEYQILQLLSAATESVDVALLSFSPVTHDGQSFYPELDTALRSAAVRGVEVRLMVSHWMEKKKVLDHLLSLDELDNVEVRACRVAPAASGEIPFARVHHSKYLVTDRDRAWLGTSNWGYGYFHESRNYGMVFLKGPIPERLDRLFEFDWERSSSLEDHREEKI
jgi:phosphatidylserine/phosphatidylglycerophosphate/cardiolipin synthase-like enzyme